MPVTGIGSPSTPRTTSTNATSNTTPTTGPAPQPPVGNAGWQANGNGIKPLDLSLPPPSVSQADLDATRPSPVRQQLEASLTTFNSRVETALNHDAMSIARGRTPAREGEPLSAQQQTDLRNAATDLMKDMPIGAFAPEVASAIQSKLAAAGINTRDISGTRLKDLGNIGGDIAKDLIKDLKQDSPTAFYSLAATLAAGVGVAAWTGGSAKLNSLGIKPEIKQGFFDDQLQVKLRGNWDAHFKNFNVTGTVSGKVDLGDAGRLTGSVTANSATGFDNARVQYDFNRPNLNLSAYASANARGLETAGGSVVYRPNDHFSLSGGVNHNFQTDRTTANAEAAWRVNKDVDFALSASHDSRGDSRVGAGLRIRF